MHVHDDVGRELDRYLREARFGAEAEAPLFATRSGACFTEAGFDKIFQRLADRSALRGFSAHVLRHTWATNFMRAPHASLLELKRQGGWERWDMVERYSHATPPRDRSALPNPLQKSALQKSALHKSAFSQPPSSTQKRLSLVRTASG